MNTTMVTAARAITVCIAAALGFASAEAFAGNLSEGETVAATSLKYVVRFADLDLSRIGGVTTLYVRLSYAARVVCEPFQVPGIALKDQGCFDKAIADAVATINRPLLSQYHQLRTKGDRAGLKLLAQAD